jgi:hypothetical protein
MRYFNDPVKDDTMSRTCYIYARDVFPHSVHAYVFKYYDMILKQDDLDYYYYFLLFTPPTDTFLSQLHSVIPPFESYNLCD